MGLFLTAANEKPSLLKLHKEAVRGVGERMIKTNCVK
jgi:hypothetical protein